jgi:hypothetical protein
MIESL